LASNKPTTPRLQANRERTTQTMVQNGKNAPKPNKNFRQELMKLTIEEKSFGCILIAKIEYKLA